MPLIPAVGMHASTTASGTQRLRTNIGMYSTQVLGHVWRLCTNNAFDTQCKRQRKPCSSAQQQLLPHEGWHMQSLQLPPATGPFQFEEPPSLETVHKTAAAALHLVGHWSSPQLQPSTACTTLASNGQSAKCQHVRTTLFTFDLMRTNM